MIPNTSDNSTQTQAPHHQNRIIRLSELRHKTGLATSTIYELIQQNKFPKQVRLSSRSIGWSEREIDQWIEDRLNSRESV